MQLFSISASIWAGFQMDWCAIIPMIMRGMAAFFKGENNSPSPLIARPEIAGKGGEAVLFDGGANGAH